MCLFFVQIYILQLLNKQVFILSMCNYSQIINQSICLLPLLGNEGLVGEAFSNITKYQIEAVNHLETAGVVAQRKLVHIGLQVLKANPMVDSFSAVLEVAPKALYAIGVGQPIHVPLGAVAHNAVLVHLSDAK